jgi:hypothetical protein
VRVLQREASVLLCVLAVAAPFALVLAGVRGARRRADRRLVC